MRHLEGRLDTTRIQFLAEEWWTKRDSGSASQSRGTREVGSPHFTPHGRIGIRHRRRCGCGIGRRVLIRTANHLCVPMHTSRRQRRGRRTVRTRGYQRGRRRRPKNPEGLYLQTRRKGRGRVHTRRRRMRGNRNETRTEAQRNGVQIKNNKQMLRTRRKKDNSKL